MADENIICLACLFQIGFLSPTIISCGFKDVFIDMTRHVFKLQPDFILMCFSFDWECNSSYTKRNFCSFFFFLFTHLHLVFCVFYGKLVVPFNLQNIVSKPTKRCWFYLLEWGLSFIWSYFNIVSYSMLTYVNIDKFERIWNKRSTLCGSF